ncbi:MAG: hypothetical protein ACI35O_02440 [Bacillaceae bacterium]
MFTTYDEIWETFLLNCKTDDINIPQAQEKIYATIRNAVMHFKNRTRDKINCIDETETLDVKLSDDHLLILANFIRLIFLRNEKTYFETQWQPFQQDIGIRNFSSQIKSMEGSIEEQKDTIDEMFKNTEVDYL